MIARLTADFIVLFHLIFILFVLLGGLLVLKWWKIALLHLPCVIWGVLIEFSGWICPLTPLENHFRTAAGTGGYSGGFVEHYIMPLIYPPGLDRNLQIILGIIVLIINLTAYTLILLRRSKQRRS